jgi:rare lipoprotein A
MNQLSKLFIHIKSFRLFDLHGPKYDNKCMSDPTMKVVGTLQGQAGRKLLQRAGVLAVTLGLSASAVASPTVKREIAKAPSAQAKHHWFQIGKASWYGGQFNGRQTANGEVFDMYALTCAHRTLPLGTWVRVTNLHNKKTVFLRVNDRGPMSTSLVMDLSYGAAHKLGIDGLGKVRIEQISPTDPLLVQQLVAQLPLSNDPMVLAPMVELQPSLNVASVVLEK